MSVYFLRGKYIGGEEGGGRSQLPGMALVYRAECVKNVFAKLADIWNGVCW